MLYVILHISPLKIRGRNGSIMKKTLLLAWLVACMMFNAQAQNPLKNGIQAGYGILSVPLMIEQTGDILLTIFSIGFYDQPDKVSSTGVLNLGYNYYINRRISVGVDYGWEKISITWNDDRPEGYESYTVIINSITGGLKYHFIVKQNFGMYSRLLVGVAIPVRSKETFHPFPIPDLAFQLTPVGVFYGNKFQVFSELGYGFRGLLNLGINIKF